MYVTRIKFLFQGFPGFGFGDGGFHMSFGIGAFPFGIFASTLNLNDGRPGPRKYKFYNFWEILDFCFFLCLLNSIFC